MVYDVQVSSSAYVLFGWLGVADCAWQLPAKVIPPPIREHCRIACSHNYGGRCRQLVNRAAVVLPRWTLHCLRNSLKPWP
jgi:hypothetical protein